jgi:hypothetical protein
MGQNTDKISRWVFFIPVAIVIYCIAKLSISWTLYYVNDNVIKDMLKQGDLGGHYLLGTLFLFIRESFAVGFGVYSGVYLAPSNKRTVFLSFLGFWIAYLLIISLIYSLILSEIEIPIERIFSNFTEVVAQLVGFIASGIYIWREFRA